MIYAIRRCVLFLILNYAFFFIFEIFSDILSPFCIRFYATAIPVASAWFFLIRRIEALISLILLGCLMDAMYNDATFGLSAFVQIALYAFLLGKKNTWWNLSNKEARVTITINAIFHLGLLTKIIFFSKIPTLFFAGTLFPLLCSFALTSIAGFSYLLWQKTLFKVPLE